MTTYDTLQSGTATISGDPDFSDGPWTVHGVAQAAEITRGVSGERRFWPPETLRDAAEKLVGTPVVSPEEHEDLTPGQPDPRTVIGEVVAASYDEDREALIYEAELDDPEFAKLAARGRIDVSPSVALREGETDPDRDTTRVAEVLDYRDLAAVTEGAHDSASLHLGTAEALAAHFGIDVDALQEPAEANATDVDVSPPEAVQNAAQAALDAKEEYAGAIGDCGTGVGETRAEQIVSDDLEPADFVTRNDDRTPIPAYLASHEEDAPDTDQPPTDWGEETWTDGCGPVQYALWGGTATGTGIEWAQRTANEVMRALDEEPVYEGLAPPVSDGVVFSNFGGDPFQSEDELSAFIEDLESAGASAVYLGDEAWPDVSGIHDRPVYAADITPTDAMSVFESHDPVAINEPTEIEPEGLQRDRARTPTYSGTQDTSWSAPDLDDYLTAYDSLPTPAQADSVDDLSRDQRSLIARKSLLGTAAGETLREVRFFPVVDPETDELNRRALGAVRSGRGAQADIPDDARASARTVAGELLIEEFGSDIEVDSMADVSDVQEGTLVEWDSSGDRNAYGRVEEVRTEDDDALDGEIDGDQTIDPPAALIEVHRPTGDDGGWEPSGTMVGHTLNTDTLSVVESLPDPDSLANHRASDDGANDPQLQSTPANNTVFDQTMSDLTDAEQELLAAARQLDDPTVVEAGVSERLSTHDELLDEFESAEDPTVVETTDYETLQERVDTIEGLLADALQDRTGLSDAAIEAMPFEAMATEFETDDGDLDVDALAQTPETGSGGADESGSAEVDTERLSEIKTKLDHAEAALPDSRVEALREEAADLADADDYDAAIEVL